MSVVKPLSLGEHKAAALIGLVIFLVVGGGTAYGLHTFASNSANNGSLTTPTGANIANMVSTVQGWNGTKWEAATLTTTAASNDFTATFTAGFKVQQIEIFTDNSTYNTKGMLENSLIFQNVKVTTTNMKMNYLYGYIAQYQNSSSTNKVADKSVTHINQNITIYSNNTNKIGKDLEYNLVKMFGVQGLEKSYNEYQMGAKVTNTSAVSSFVFTMILEKPFAINMISLFYWTMAIFGLVSVVFLIGSIPRRYD